MAGAYLLTGRFSVPDTYEKYISAEAARLNLERTQLKASGSKDAAHFTEIRLRLERERLMHLGNDSIWNAYDERFRKILERTIDFGIFHDIREVKTYAR